MSYFDLGPLKAALTLAVSSLLTLTYLSAGQVLFLGDGKGVGGDTGLTYSSTTHQLTVTKLAVTSSTASNLIPSTDNSFSLGASTASWSNIYASGTLAVPNILASTVTSSILAATTRVKIGTGVNLYGLDVQTGQARIGTVNAGATGYASRQGVLFLNRNDITDGTFLNRISTSISGTAVDNTINIEPGNAAAGFAAGLTVNGLGNVGIQKGQPAAGVALDVNGTVSSTGLMTGLNNSADIGGAQSFKNIYASGTAFVGGLTSGGTVGAGLFTSINYTCPTTAYRIGNLTDGMAYPTLGTGNGIAICSGATDIAAFRTSGIIIRGGTPIYPDTNNTNDLGTEALSFKNIYATGTQIVFAGLAANDVTDSFVCKSATGTLRWETASCTVSSMRFKEHVESLSPSDLLAKVSKLRAVSFDYTNGGNWQLHTSSDEGFIAEEVAMIDPYLVSWLPASDADLKKIRTLYPSVPRLIKGEWYIPHAVAYDKLSVLFAGAIQAEDVRITKLENRVGIIERFVDWLKSLIK